MALCSLQGVLGYPYKLFGISLRAPWKQIWSFLDVLWFSIFICYNLLNLHRPLLSATWNFSLHSHSKCPSPSSSKQLWVEGHAFRFVGSHAFSWPAWQLSQVRRHCFAIEDLTHLPSFFFWVQKLKVAVSSHTLS